MKKFEIELVNVATVILEIEAQTLEEAEEIALKKVTFEDWDTQQENFRVIEKEPSKNDSKNYSLVGFLVKQLK